MSDLCTDLASDPLWRLLAIDATDDRAAIDRAYREACRAGKESDELHDAWKLLRDPYYRAMRRHYRSRAAFKEAGFFDDGLDTQLEEECYTDLAWLTTPYHKILARLSQLDSYDPAQLAAYPPLVLLTTGGFSPIHNGHIDMMELAKNELIQLGHPVLGGYLSPSHDSYVSTKDNGAAQMLDEHRIRLCHEAVATNEWIMVDPWEARYVPCAINYTDVIVRLERYLNHHLPLPVPLRVAYVFGGDNAAFARAFTAEGYAVCVERPGYETRVEAIKQEMAYAKERIVFARPRLEYFNISSSGIRAATMSGMPERASGHYRQLQENFARASDPIPQRRFLIRNESAWVMQPWCDDGRDTAEVKAAADRFLEDLMAALRTAFVDAPLPDQALELRIEAPDLERQAAYAEALQRETPTITLDACTSGTYRLNISRLFGLADGQCFAMQIVPRPGFPRLTDQVQAIPPGDYALLDDDIASGRTMRMVMAVFPPGIKITRILSLLEQTRSVDALRVDQIDYEDFYDVVDLRDCLFGARGGGIVIRLPDGQIARVPYMAPYVTLSTRIRLPASQEVWFSLAMWRANERFFASIAPPIRVGDCDPAAQSLLRTLRFAPSTPVIEVVRWHREMLERSTRRHC
jgi:nicotinic acid mononucleotide adenylyltransferase